MALWKDGYVGLTSTSSDVVVVAYKARKRGEMERKTERERGGERRKGKGR